MSCGSVQPSHHMNVHTNLKISALCVVNNNRDIAIGELKCDTKYRPVFAQCNNSITPVLLLVVPSADSSSVVRCVVAEESRPCGIR